MSSSRLLNLFRNSANMRRTCPPGTRIASVRRSRFHSSPAARYAYKDDQSKDSLQPKSTEYSKSGSDAEAAETDEAFDPSKTSPESQKGDSGSGAKPSNGHPLEMSPANKESSKARDPNEGGATSAPGESEGGRDRTSGAGSAKKAGGAKSG